MVDNEQYADDSQWNLKKNETNCKKLVHSSHNRNSNTEIWKHLEIVKDTFQQLSIVLR